MHTCAVSGGMDCPRVPAIAIFRLMKFVEKWACSSSFDFQKRCDWLETAVLYIFRSLDGGNALEVDRREKMLLDDLI